MNWKNWSAATLIFAHSAGAAAAIEIGWVESIQGKAEDVRIQRDKAALPAARFQTLLEGDKVLVKKGSQVDLRIRQKRCFCESHWPKGKARTPRHPSAPH